MLSRQRSFNASGQLPITELEAIFELAFLRVFVNFEDALTDILKINMTLEKDSIGNKRSLFVAPTYSAAGRLLLHTSRYFSVMPIDELEKKAKVYLKDGKPFTNLTTAQKTEVRKAYSVRNHIAHRSPDSKLKYSANVLNTAVLPKTSYVPGFYLRSLQTANRSYFDHHVAELGGVIRTLI